MIKEQKSVTLPLFFCSPHSRLSVSFFPHFNLFFFFFFGGGGGGRASADPHCPKLRLSCSGGLEWLSPAKADCWGWNSIFTFGSFIFSYS